MPFLGAQGPKLHGSYVTGNGPAQEERRKSWPVTRIHGRPYLHPRCPGGLSLSSALRNLMEIPGQGFGVIIYSIKYYYIFYYMYIEYT